MRFMRIKGDLLKQTLRPIAGSRPTFEFAADMHRSTMWPQKVSQYQE